MKKLSNVTVIRSLCVVGAVGLLLAVTLEGGRVGSVVTTPTVTTTESTNVSTTEPPPSTIIPPTSATTTVVTTTTPTTIPGSTIPGSTTTTIPGSISYDDPTLAPVCGVPSGSGCRLIAYYGTPLSKRMGVLGASPPTQMLSALKKQTARWQAQDPATPTRCVLELISVIAQGAPGASGLYRSRTSPEVIEKVLGWARSAGCLLVLDVQVGWSNVPDELPHLLPFLAQPDVHLALDPEWDMQPGAKPGTRIGTMSAADINVAVDALHRLVVENKLPPKLLVVHRFRGFMVTNPANIKTGPTVRLVANMDGFGPPAQKIGGYSIARDEMPTDLGGFKLFFKNDKPILEPKNLVPQGVVTPAPVFINYQ